MSAAAVRPLQQGALHLEDADFRFFQSVIEEIAGIHLSDVKKELVQSRLRSHLGALEMQSFSEYRDYLSSLPRQNPEWQVFVNLLTTNKTDFFREAAHFDYLKNQFLPEWLKLNPSGELKVWCAASSTGEEPYTLAMVLNEALPAGRSYSIHASDIDTQVLKKAKGGVYSRSKLVEIPDSFRKDWDMGTGEIKDWMRIKPHLKSKVSFFQFNLAGSELPSVDQFDLVFCRNVLIYFKPSTIEGVMKKLYQVAKPGAQLFIGHSESLQNIQTDWKNIRPSIYFKRRER